MKEDGPPEDACADGLTFPPGPVSWVSYLCVDSVTRLISFLEVT